MHLRVLQVLFVVLIISASAVIYVSLDALPEMVASKFGNGGIARGFMGRSQYMGLMVGLMVGIPLLMLLGLCGLPRQFPRMTNIPNKTYWIAPERRATMQAVLDRAGVALACTSLAFLASMHGLIVEANEHLPPRMDMRAFFLCLVLFLAIIVSLSIWLSLRLRKPS